MTGDNWKTPLIHISEIGHSVTPLKDATDALKETKKVVEFCLGEVCVASDYRTTAAKTNAPHHHPHFKFKFRHESNVLIYVMQRHVEKL